MTTMREVFRRAALVALREVAEGCSRALGGERDQAVDAVSDRVHSLESRIEAFREALRAIASKADASRMGAKEEYRLPLDQWSTTPSLSDVLRMVEALSEGER